MSRPRVNSHVTIDGAVLLGRLSETPSFVLPSRVSTADRRRLRRPPEEWRDDARAPARRQWRLDLLGATGW